MTCLHIMITKVMSECTECMHLALLASLGSHLLEHELAASQGASDLSSAALADLPLLETS